MASDNNRIREAKYDFCHYGFNVKRGMLFGMSDGNDFIWTGKIRPLKRFDKKSREYTYSYEVLTFFRPHKKYDVPDQTARRSDWYPRWITCDNGIGEKILDRSVKRKYKIIPDYNPRTPSEGRHWFKSDKSRFDHYSAAALWWENN